MPSFHHGDVEIAYLDEGEGDPILLVHGFASTKNVNWAYPGWVTELKQLGRRVIALDNRGHGESAKLYDSAQYEIAFMASDVIALMDHLQIDRADIMGYSMGARISSHLTLAHPERVRSLLLGGLGIHLVEGVGLPLGIADAMEAPSLADLTDPMQRMFRAFAENTGSDLRALAACIRGTRQTLSRQEVGRIAVPTLVSVGTKDDVSGSGPELAALIPGAESFAIEGRDHNLAVGDRTHKQAVVEFLARRP